LLILGIAAVNAEILAIHSSTVHVFLWVNKNACALESANKITYPIE